MRAPRWPLVLVLALAACDGGSSATHQVISPGPHVVVRIAYIEDDVCGTSCPSPTGERVVRLAADGTYEPFEGPALAYGPGAQPWA